MVTQIRALSALELAQIQLSAVAGTWHKSFLGTGPGRCTCPGGSAVNSAPAQHQQVLTRPLQSRLLGCTTACWVGKVRTETAGPHSPQQQVSNVPDPQQRSGISEPGPISRKNKGQNAARVALSWLLAGLHRRQAHRPDRSRHRDRPHAEGRVWARHDPKRGLPRAVLQVCPAG